MPAARAALIWLIALFLLAGCAGQEGPRDVLLDTPAQHVSSGLRLLEANKIDDAEREFKAAIFRNESYAGAYVGLSLVAVRQGRLDEAWEFLEKARTLANEKWELDQMETARMEILMVEAGPGWLAKVEEAYIWTTSQNIKAPQATYLLALAYLQAHRFEQAKVRFHQVAAQGGSYVFLAREGVRLCDNVLEAAPRTAVGRQATLARSMTRAELAELIVAEINLPWPEPPEKPLAQDLPTDLPQARAISQLLAADIPSLLPPEGKLFMPMNKAKRQDLAQAAVALVAAISGRPTPRPYPFPPDITDLPRPDDLRQAVELALEWGLIETRAPRRFDPWGSVSGPTALVVLRRAERLGLKIKERQP